MMRVHSSARGDVAGAVAAGEQRTERLAGDARVLDLAGGQRGHRRVEPLESLPHSALRDQREPAVGQRAHLEVVIAELQSDVERPLGAALELDRVRSVACHQRELEVAPLDARADLLERAPGSLEPSLLRGPVPEGAPVEGGEQHRHASGRRQIAAIAIPAKRCFGMPPASLEIVVGERLPGEHPARIGAARLDHRHHTMLGATGTRE